MSDVENILARWARRKSEARPASKPGEVSGRETAESDAPALPDENSEPFDLSSLPLIESINAETDLRVFFAKGVPADLTRAALRAGWSADPAIRDFIGLSENSWDFNDPKAMHGFGTLEPAEVQKILAQMLESAGTTEVAVQTPNSFSDEKIDALSDRTAAGNFPLHPGQVTLNRCLDENSEGLPTASERLEAQNAGPSKNRSSTEYIGPSDQIEEPGQFLDRPELLRRRHGGATPRKDGLT